MAENGKENSGFAKFRLPLAFIIAGLTFLSAGIYYTLEKNKSKDIKIIQEETASSSAQIVVHIAGEVESPGVYHLPAGSRINDLIEKSGGFTSKASREYIDKILNLAQVLKDGAKIYIPSDEENQKGEIAGVKNIAGEKININSASLSQLETLSDIGAVRAQKIIDNRPYSAIDELLEKKIIPQSTFEKIKEKISVY